MSHGRLSPLSSCSQFISSTVDVERRDVADAPGNLLIRLSDTVIVISPLSYQAPPIIFLFEERFVMSSPSIAAVSSSRGLLHFPTCEEALFETACDFSSAIFVTDPL